MSLLNFLKKDKKSKEYKQKEARKSKQAQKKPKILDKKKEPKVLGKEKEEKKEKPIKETKLKKGKVSESSYKILVAPLVTEKSSMLEKESKYVFKVFPKTNKTTIKRAVEDIYKVDVLTVRIINIPKKPRKMGRYKTFKKGYKKAIIKLKEGQRIDIISR
ncbi:MAG: 50S ribosomal protein L23 [Patescibacteria group bacterium]|nr:50S ribosomal protein L23 [Patescibacteria group bacterium]